VYANYITMVAVTDGARGCGAVETSNFPEDVVRENLLIGGGVNVRIYKIGRIYARV